MKNKEISIDTFSVLSNIGFSLTLLKVAGVISTSWTAITNYWLALLGISVVLSLVTTIVGWASKGGDKGGDK